MHEPFPSLLLHISFSSVPQLIAIVTIKYELKTYLQKAQASMEHTFLRSVGRVSSKPKQGVSKSLLHISSIATDNSATL